MGGYCIILHTLYDKYFVTHKEGNCHTSAILLITGCVSLGNLYKFSFIFYVAKMVIPLPPPSEKFWVVMKSK